MTTEEQILELYSEQRDEGLAAMASICGYAELFSNKLFGTLTDEQHKLIEQIKSECPKAIECWCLFGIELELDIDVPVERDLYELYGILRNEGLTVLYSIEGCAKRFLISKEELPRIQCQAMEMIVKQGERAVECWWYPERHL
jgi:hypothetical protein